MDRNLAEKLVEIIEYNDDCKLYEDYSGRGMYGKTTTGISTNASMDSMLCMVIENADQFVDENGDALFPEIHFRMDQLGYIYY